uniref:Candidate secreted effector n=1 Tax=Meloidogyne incognita TaxID=6306 RepID=A0A914L7F4_MELIC
MAKIPIITRTKLRTLLPTSPGLIQPKKTFMIFTSSSVLSTAFPSATAKLKRRMAPISSGEEEQCLEPDMLSEQSKSLAKTRD